MKTMKVESIINQRGNAVPNQFVITDEKSNTMTFQSYASTIAIVDYNKHSITFGCDYNYSNTTNRHENTFFSDYAKLYDLNSASARHKAIKDGTYNGWKVIYNKDLY